MKAMKRYGLKRYGLKRYGLLTAAVGLSVAMLAVASPAWAAFPGNNGKIAFTKVPTTFQNQEIFAVDADGSNPTNLSNNPALDTHAAWSADGTKIAFTSARDGNNEIYTMNADGTEQTNVSNSVKDEILPAWSPDDTKIAFRSDRDGNPEIYTMNADGSNPTRLTNIAGEDSVPAWSADGTKIAFSSNRNGNYDIYTMNADGTEQTNLSNNAAVDLHPAWSPDGTEIAFESTRAGNYEIYKMNADGSSPTNLSNNPRTEAEPDWSPDGTKITFRSQRDNDNEIYTMNATDGSDPRNVSNHLGMIDYWPSWQPSANSAPTAKDDPTTAGDSKYSVDQDGSLTVSASDGVLDNDTDPENNPITAMKASDPTNGTLTLSSDGSFTYTPSAGFSGTDSFTYKANDGTTDSNVATVNITVNTVMDTTAPTLNLPEDITEQEATGPEGAPVSWQTPTATDENPANPQVSCDADSGDTFPIGTTTVNCSATDEAGNTARGSFDVTVQDTTDKIKPKVTGTSPLAGATRVLPGANVAATFSEKMDPLSITKSTFKLFKVKPDGSTTQITNVTVKLSTDGLTAKLNPFGTSSTLLGANTKYKGVITTGAKDVAGNPLDQNPTATGSQQKGWFFTTRA